MSEPEKGISKRQHEINLQMKYEKELEEYEMEQKEFMVNDLTVPDEEEYGGES